MEIDEKVRDKVRKSLEQELGREVTDDEVAASYRRINLYLASIDLNVSSQWKKISGYEILAGWLK